jgi:hypothetical protein
MGLTARDRARYTRHLLLTQLGDTAQERLLATRVRVGSNANADAGALAVARTYLTRAGVTFSDDENASELGIATSSEVERLAGRRELLEPARALAGALAAVSAIQAAAQLEWPSTQTATVVISSEEA